jgi:hypothetical protein
MKRLAEKLSRVREIHHKNQRSSSEISEILKCTHYRKYFFGFEDEYADSGGIAVHWESADNEYNKKVKVIRDLANRVFDDILRDS